MREGGEGELRNVNGIEPLLESRHKNDGAKKKKSTAESGEKSKINIKNIASLTIT